MRSLSQALTSSTTAGAPLPPLSPALARAGVVIRRGQVTMIAGQPGGGKTFLAGAYALSSGLRTLYISADTDPFTMIRRFAARILGLTQDEVETTMNSDRAEIVEDALLEDLEKISWSFDPSPSLEDVDLELRAYEEMWGSPPELLVVDSLYSIWNEDGGDEWSSMKGTMKALHYMARQSQAAVLALHHTSEAEGNAKEPPSRKAILGKISQHAEVILTLGYDEVAGEMKVAAVKNRNGVADPTGKSFVTLHCDLSRSLISDDRSVIHNAKLRAQWT